MNQLPSCRGLRFRLVRSCFATVLPVLMTLPLVAADRTQPRDLVIAAPTDLPEQARLAADGCFLAWDNAGQTYLYVEQQHGARLTAFNVTNPSRITLVYSSAMTVPGPYDFVQAIDSRRELVRFRDGRGTAVLDIRKPASPSFKMLEDSQQARSAEPLGRSLLLASGSGASPSASTHDLQVVDPSTTPALIASVKQVAQKLENPYTGTTFLVGSEGLTVIRRPGLEPNARTRTSE